ncbi:MAG: DUF6458 family protein [Jatrophihabitans sp.]
MRLGASLFLIAVGAILKFAVTKTVQGIDLGVVGVVLMIVGVVGLVAEMVMWGMRRQRAGVVYGAAPVVQQPVVQQPVVERPVVERDRRY